MRRISAASESHARGSRSGTSDRDGRGSERPAGGGLVSSASGFVDTAGVSTSSTYPVALER